MTNEELRELFAPHKRRGVNPRYGFFTMPIPNEPGEINFSAEITSNETVQDRIRINFDFCYWFDGDAAIMYQWYNVRYEDQIFDMLWIGDNDDGTDD